MNDYDRANALFFTALCIYVFVILTNISKSYPHAETPPPPPLFRGGLPQISKDAEELHLEVEALRAGMMLRTP